MNPFGALGIEGKLIAGGVLLLALVLGAWALVHHLKAEGAADVTAAYQHAADVKTAEFAAETTRRETKQQENLHDSNQFDAQRAADARDLDAVVQRVHDAATSGRLTPAHSAAAGAGEAASVPDSGMVSAELFARARAAFAETAADAAELSKSLDCARGAVELCASDYEALTP